MTTEKVDGRFAPVVSKQNQADKIREIGEQAALIDKVLRELMREGEHYGVIPGTKKPCLFKAGAEKLALLFRLQTDLTTEKTELGNGHREYFVTCRLITKEGLPVGAGVGSATTLESKYRYRKNFRTQKKEENPDIADTFNTVLKMAKKRALVDAVLTACAASDLFAQDEEVLAKFGDEKPISPAPSPKEFAVDSYPFRYGLTKAMAVVGAAKLNELRTQKKLHRQGDFIACSEPIPALEVLKNSQQEDAVSAAGFADDFLPGEEPVEEAVDEKAALAKFEEMKNQVNK